MKFALPLNVYHKLSKVDKGETIYQKRTFTMTGPDTLACPTQKTNKKQTKNKLNIMQFKDRTHP